MRGLDTTENMIMHVRTLKQHGVSAVGRYIAGGTWKQLSVEEADALHAADIKILPIFERDPTDARYFTPATAMADYSHARNVVGDLQIPSTAVIWYAVDFDASQSDLIPIIQYFSTLIDQIRHHRADGYEFPGVGVYGSGRVLQAVRDKWPVRTWLSESVGWAGYDAWKTEADIVQTVKTDDLGFDYDWDFFNDINLGF